MENLEIDIVCPVFKNLDQAKEIYESCFKQKNVLINNIVFPITLCGNHEIDDELVNFAKNNNISFFTETMSSFSHSLTREKAINLYCKSKIVILLSQDVRFANEYALFNLGSAIKGKVAYAYGKQVSRYKGVEKYIREFNYKKDSYCVTRKDIERLQIKAFFASDAFSAINREVFLNNNGYKGYNVMMNEDMLYAKFVLDEGFSVAYCSTAIVEHSHKYTFKALYKRYYETGVFFKTVRLFDQYNTNGSGLKLALYVLIRSIKALDFLTIIRWFPDMATRYIGMKRGRKNG